MPRWGVRILHVVTRSQRRGAETVALELAEELDRLGHEDVVIALASGLDGGRDDALPPLVDGRAVGGATSVRHLWRLWRRIARDRPDVVLAHGGEAAKLAALLPRRSRPPVVWQRILGFPAGGLSPTRRLLWRVVTRRVSAGVAISPPLAEELRDLGLDGQVIEVPNTRRASTFASLDRDEAARALRAELGVPPGTPLVGLVGHLVAQKRPERSVAVLHHLRAAGVDARLVVVGDGPERGRVEDEARRLGVEEHVTLLGHRGDVPSLLAGLDVVLLTSDAEGVAGVVVEAQMAGRPVVAFEGLGAELGMVPGVSGCLVPHGDTAAMAAAAAELLRDPARLARMADAARTSSDRFATEVVVRDYDALLRSVAGGARPRVLLLLPSFGVGGAEQSLLILARTGDRTRFTPVAASLRAPTHDVGSTVVPPLAAAGLPVHDLRLPRRADRSPLGLLVAAWHLRRHCLDHEVDVVDSCLFEADLVARVALVGTGVRHVVHLVNTPYDPMALRFGAHRSRWRLPMIKKVDALTAPLTDSFVAITRAVGDAARRDLGVPASKVVVIERGVELSRFPELPPPVHVDGALRLLAVGRLAPQKGHVTAIRAVAEARRRGVDVRLSVVGEGPIAGELRDEVTRLDLDGAVELLGRRTDIRELHASHDAFCFPSLWEGQGNALLEAMACGRAALASDIPVLREVLGDAGRFAPPGDERAFADGMVELSALGAEGRAELGRRARRRVEEHYDAEQKVQRLVEHYRSVAAQN